MHFSREEQYLLSQLKAFLTGEEGNEYSEEASAIDKDGVIQIAKKHSVLSFLGDIVCRKALFQNNKAYIERECQRIVLQSYHLLFLTRFVSNLLKEHGIDNVVLKGIAIAGMYKVPELRKSGDVDILIPGTADWKLVMRVMQENGFHLGGNEGVNYHVAFKTPDGINIEIHTTLTEDFANQKVNRAMKKHLEQCWDNIEQVEVMGVMVPCLNKPYHAYGLLLHMLHHFMGTGFGLKLLCDWVVIWGQVWTPKEKEDYNRLIGECGLEKFSALVSETCIQYLGMEDGVLAGEKQFIDSVGEFMREILASGEFGSGDSARMVMLQGTGVWDYIREFHHQMCLNFPKAGKCFLIWPLLWLVTMVRFLYNNCKLRKTSTRKILREAARRSRLMKQINLFK